MSFDLIDPGPHPSVPPAPLPALSFNRLVATLILLFGIVFVFIVPPLQTPDEDSHFTRAVMISEGKIRPKVVDGQKGQYVPTSLIDYVQAHRYLVFHTEQKYAYARWTGDSQAVTHAKPTIFHSYSGQGLPPTLYLPQTAGILAGHVLFKLVPFKGLHYDWSDALYFARLGNLFSFAAAVALSTSLASRYRAVFAAVALMPMVMQAAASSSYDTTVIAVAMLFLALMARICSASRTPTRNEYIALLALAFFLGDAKAVYTPLLLLTIVFKRRLAWRPFLIGEAGLLAAACVGIAGVPLLFGSSDSASQTALYVKQVAFLFHSPLSALHLVTASLSDRGDFYLITFLGQLGWLDTNFAMGVLVLIWGVLICAVVGDALGGPSPFAWLGSGALAASIAISVVAVFMALYVTWTSQTVGIGAPVVDGVQGRYFLPLLPFAMVTAAALPRQFAQRFRRLRQEALTVQLTVSVAILMVMTFTIMVRFWVPQPA